VAETNSSHTGRRSESRHPDQSSSTTSPANPAKRVGNVLAGVGWNTIGQFLILGINLALTPFLLHRIGATAYGIFALVSSARGLISNLDGGLGPTGYRYFPVYVGRGNSVITTSLLVTMLALLGIIVGFETVTTMLLAPDIAKLFALGSSLKAYSNETAQLFRILMPALLLAALLGPIERLLMAHHRWALLSYTGIIASVTYAVVAFIASFKTSGVACLVWGMYAQQAVMTVALLWACRRYISLRGIRLLPLSEVRQILRFGWKVQIAALASSLNFEVDALLVGALFPVSNVAYYSIGVNFSQQVLAVPVNGLNPITQEVGRSFGRSGKAGVLESFGDTQRKWVSALAGFPAIAAVQGWFGISAWLGHGSQIAAVTAAVLILGFTPLLLNSIVDITAKIVEMPEIESWYLGIGVIINVACTIPLALRFGVIGVPLGTAIGEVVSFFICIYLAQKKIGREITPFFYDVRYGPALVAAALAAASEWAFRNSMPTGSLGFVLCGLLTLPGFIAYYGWVYRELLLKRLGGRTSAVPAVTAVEQSQRDESRWEAAAKDEAAEDEERDSSYAGRQLKGVQVLMALSQPARGQSADGSAVSSQPNASTSRQLSGIQALMALAEPEVLASFSGASVRLRYTNSIEQSGHPRQPPSRGGREIVHE
jgi:O-antigen/teichoic acid export membrane protein